MYCNKPPKFSSICISFAILFNEFCHIVYWKSFKLDRFVPYTFRYKRRYLHHHISHWSRLVVQANISRNAPYYYVIESGAFYTYQIVCRPPRPPPPRITMNSVFFFNLFRSYVIEITGFDIIPREGLKILP